MPRRECIRQWFRGNFVKVTLGGTPLSPQNVRDLGFSLVNLATLMDRSVKQASQADENPNHKERAEARAAANRVKDAVAMFNALSASLKR